MELVTFMMGALLSFSFLHFTECRNRLEIIQLNATCDSSGIQPNSIVSIFRCGLGKSFKRPTMTLEIQFSEDVNEHYNNVRIVLPRRREDFVLINITRQEGCTALLSKSGSPLMSLFRANAKSYSNFPHKCPYRKNVLYYIRGFRFNMDLLSAFQFETDMLFYWDMIIPPNVLKSYVKTRITMKNSANGR